MRLIAKILDYFEYPVLTGFYKGLRLKGSLEFIHQFKKLTTEQRFFSNLDLKDKIIYDVGGYKGYLTGFFALKAQQVYTFEPNPYNIHRIYALTKHNNLINVRVFEIAVGEKQDTAELTFNLDKSAQGSIDPQISENIKHCKKIIVQVDSLDNQILKENLLKPDFVKIDVEGYEIPVLYGMKKTIEKYKPDLHVEIHGIGEEKKKNAFKVIDYLSRFDYSLLHVERNAPVKVENADLAFEGHIFAHT